MSVFQLAGFLAAAPLNLRLISLVQRILPLNANLSVLAKLMPAEPLCRTVASGGRCVATQDFVDGVREELLTTGTTRTPCSSCRLHFGSRSHGRQVPILAAQSAVFPHLADHA
ncbi:hypothetical protein [Umezawaea sp. NPDC059074]|uniref:hypothetical protein n=1 Tax=Umezawaea sp. NPDC059074 TaxID=3346716 RepID=UPI0036A57BFF